MAQEQIKQITIQADSNFAQVCLISQAVRGVCSLLPISQTELGQIELAVVEALNNVIEHAYKNEPGHVMQVVVTLSSQEACIAVHDTGGAIPPDIVRRMKAVSLSFDSNVIETLPEGGMGLYLITQSMDDVTYTSHNGTNVLTLKKHIHHTSNLPTQTRTPI